MALQLLMDYGSGSSDDESVPGPRVSCKRTFKDSSEEIISKRISR